MAIRSIAIGVVTFIVFFGILTISRLFSDEPVTIGPIILSAIVGLLATGIHHAHLKIDERDERGYDLTNFHFF